MKKKTFPLSQIRTPAGRMLGDHIRPLDNLPLLQSTKQAGVFLGKCVRTAARTTVVDRKKAEGTSSAIFGVGSAAKYCHFKRCADRVRSRTDNKDEVLEGKSSNLNFLPSTKKTTEYSFLKLHFCRTESFC